jgi:hypothetical protein
VFGRKRKAVVAPAATPPSVRDTLFGDGPLESWPVGDHADREPWATFVTARRFVAAGDIGNAVVGWQRVVAMPGLEARHHVQAWTFLRQYGGVQPPAAEAKRLLGVVVEVDRGPAGLDLLAAYPERTARFYAGTGGGIVWERPDTALDAHIGALLEASKAVLDRIGPWTQPRLPPPPPDHIRLNFLAPSGLHFGQAPFAVFEQDALAGPVVRAATGLLQAMMAVNQR